MTKKRVNKQQLARIEKNKVAFQENLLNMEEGLVISRHKLRAEIETLEGNRLICALRSFTDSLVAGDKVIWQKQGEDQGVILSVLPRKTLLGRTDAYHSFKPLAANISQLVIVTAVQPEISWFLLDSYLVMAECLQVKALIVLNKIDLNYEDLKQALEIYTALDYAITFTSKDNASSVDLLATHLNNEVSVIVGQSGVGKSSLINALLPEESNIQTGDISPITQLGCHTTSNARLYHLSTGGALIDSPGVREFGLGAMDSADIIYGFKEFRKATTECKFRNCNHRDSLGCAILALVAQGMIAESRYASFLRLYK